ncbi:hypothetical protein MPTK1_4g11420 [Marchantia polymorpha subsp. ruderalis]|uniref:Aminotransferase class V domain-containing protein n=2 Tax=Marchantia polymorpha TaxID=3197 RepID=A0AAF6B8T2_MARPO|nr:hypothetical protein MARPO_0011s0126 [Marchantia polymorpha]BBN08416.1 hypothetical protein Mp_4g11420 [Marchantia polymorpha subsp. ruderalis]|eukprot:PTQ46451.1 hypothetical protein MARPO_0011s0126 [Marchantia polymorpha]
MRIAKSFSSTALKPFKSKADKGGSTTHLWLHDIEATKSHEFPPYVEKTSSEQKLEWLRSQIIGNHIECPSPFGKRLISYADHTASGRSLLFIEKYIMQHLLPVYGNTHTDDSFVGQQTTHLVEEASAYVKRCLGGTERDAIFFCGTGTTAAIKRLQEIMGIAISSTLREQTLATIEKGMRWVVFVGPYEHHSNLLSWRQSLAEVVEIPLSEDGLISMDELRAALKNPLYEGRPKLGSFSACSNVTGIVTNTRTISKLLHAHGCFACFDFAASGPYVEIDMRSGQPDGYDAVFLSPHKFMGGPGTAGVLLMNKSLYLLGTGPPSTCGGGVVDFVNLDERKTIYYNEVEKREDAGTPGTIQKVRTALTFWVKEHIGTDLISSRETLLIDMAMSRFSCNPNIKIYGGTKAKRIAILSFTVYTTMGPAEDLFSGLFGSKGAGSPLLVADGRASPMRLLMKGGRRNALINSIKTHGSGNHPIKQFISLKKEQDAPRGKPLHGRFVTKLLNDLFGIQGRGGCSCAAPYAHSLMGISDELSLSIRDAMVEGWGCVKPGWARVSFAYYMTTEEFEFLVAAIEFIAEYGQRYLQFYDFDWKTGNWTFREEFRKLIEVAERYVFGKDKQHWWSGSDAPPSCFARPPLSTQALTGKLAPSLLSYLQLAQCIADFLPDQPPVRDMPQGLDPNLLTFRV